MRKRGFTLVELLAVITVIAILAVSAIAGVNAIINRQRIRIATESEEAIAESSLSRFTANNKLYIPACIDIENDTYTTLTENTLKTINNDLREQLTHDGYKTDKARAKRVKEIVKNLNKNTGDKDSFNNRYLLLKDSNCFRVTSVGTLIDDGFLKDIDNGCDRASLIIVYKRGDSSNTSGQLTSIQETGICKGSKSDDKGPSITVTPSKDLSSTAKKRIKVTINSVQGRLEREFTFTYGWSKNPRKPPEEWLHYNMTSNGSMATTTFEKSGLDEEFYFWVQNGSVTDKKGYSNPTFSTGPYSFLATPMMKYTTKTTNSETGRQTCRESSDSNCRDKERNVVYSKPYKMTMDGFEEPLCKPTCKGYTLDKWIRDDGKEINDNTIVDIKTDHTLTGSFKPKKPTVSYNSHGGSSCANFTATYDKKYGTLCETNRTGYNFKGWWTTATGGSEVTADTYVSNPNNHTLHAHWEAKEYLLTLVSSGATTPGSESVTATYDSSTLKPTITNPQKKYTVSYDVNGSGATAGKTTDTSNYTFAGWYTAETSGTKVINSSKKLEKSVSGYTNSDGEWVRDDVATFYSHWSGGSVTLPTLLRTGYSCKWHTEAAATSTGMNPSSSFIPTDNTTLYAKCTPSNYTITLRNDGATTNGSTSVTATYDSTNLSSTITNPKKEYTVTYNLNNTGATAGKTTDKANYPFTGWFTATSNGDNIINTSGALVANKTNYTNSSGAWIRDSNATLHSQWSEGSVTITSISKTGYNCTWNENSSGTGDDITPGTSFVPVRDTNIYAKCPPASYTVNLINSGATTKGTEKVTVTYDRTTISPTITNPQKKYTVTYDANGSGATLGANTATATYTFDGWYTAEPLKIMVINNARSLVKDASGYTNSDRKWIKAGGETLYSYWSGGSITLASLTKTNYVCKWYENKEGTTGEKAPNSSYVPTSDIRLYAKCTENPKYVLSFNSKGGSDCSSITRYVNNKWGTLCTPTRAHSTFGSWKNGSVTVTADTLATSSYTVTATWTCDTGYHSNSDGTACIPNTYTIKYDKGSASATGTTASTSCKYDEACVVANSGFSLGDQLFDKWVYNSDNYMPGDEILNLTTTDGASFTFTATWGVGNWYNSSKGVYYANLYNAVNSSSASNTIKLVADDLDDSSASNPATNHSLTIDLNGKSVRMHKKIISRAGGDITISNGTITNTNTMILHAYGGKITVNSGTYNTGSDITVYAQEKGTLNIKGGKFYATGDVDAVFIKDVGTTATISGGTFISGGDKAAIKNEYGSTMTITGGKVESSKNGVSNYDGTMTISGLTVEADNDAIIGGNDINTSGHEGGTITITSGTFTGGMRNEQGVAVRNARRINIQGGTFQLGTPADNSNTGIVIANGINNSDNTDVDLKGTMHISGGTIRARNNARAIRNISIQQVSGLCSENCTLKITGGTITSKNGVTIYNGSANGRTPATVPGLIKIYLSSGYIYSEKNYLFSAATGSKINCSKADLYSPSGLWKHGTGTTTIGSDCKQYKRAP